MWKRMISTFMATSIAEKFLIISIIAIGINLVVGLAITFHILMFQNALLGIGLVFLYLLPVLLWMAMLFLLKGYKKKDKIVFIVICGICCVVSVGFSIIFTVAILMSW